MQTLKEKLDNYNDHELLTEYSRRGDYTDAAVKVIEEEIVRRGLNPSTASAVQERRERAIAEVDATIKGLSRKDFEPLGCVFAKADVLIADAVLRDSDVPYIIESGDGGGGALPPPAALDALGRGGRLSADISADTFSVLIYKNAVEKARELIGEHFDAGPDGVYVSRQSDVTARLKSFSFSDIRLSDKAAHEQLEVGFSGREKDGLIKLAETLVDEADTIEEERGRVIFFYDGIEALVGKLQDNARLTRMDFLAIIELLQIYCDDSRYDRELDQTASSILSFFLG